MSLRIPEITDDRIRELAAEVDRHGVGTLPDYLHPADLRDLQAFAAAAVERSGGEYVVFQGPEAVSGTILQPLGECPAFMRLMRRVYEQATGRLAPDQRPYQTLRCVAGRTGRRETYIFHYDSYVVTFLLPILAPGSGEGGRLVIAPSVRRIRPFYAANLVDKVLLDNQLTQFVLKRLCASSRAGFRKVEIVPGNLYVFWGYRSVHASEPCAQATTRCTALIHFGDPHARSPLRRWLGRVAV